MAGRGAKIGGAHPVTPSFGAKIKIFGHNTLCILSLHTCSTYISLAPSINLNHSKREKVWGGGEWCGEK